MKFFYLCLSAVALTFAVQPVDAETTESRSLTLQTAVARAIEGHPVLRAAASEVLATEAETLQAGLRPNPVFGAEVENFAGSGSYSGTDDAEYTFSLSQTLELGGKRKKREQAALLQSKVAGWSYEEKRRAVEQLTIRSFYDALAARNRLELAQRQVKLAQSVVDKAQQRVNAGRANRLEVTKARIELADAQLNLETMANALASARQWLASLWGGSADEVGMLEGDLEQVEVPRPAEELALRLKEHPAFQQAETEILRAQAVAVLENAQRVPNVDVGAGFRSFTGSDEQAFVVGVSVPLAFGNRNQGNREAARIRVLQAEDLRSAVQLDLYQELLDRSRATRAAYEAVVSLDENQLPIAREAFEQATEGYEKGLFGSLDLLDAMRGLFAQETRYVNALLEYHQARAELDALVSPLPR